jgi:signal transduction histidine kinase
VEVVGFPQRSKSFTAIETARLQVSESRETVEPQQITAKTALDPDLGMDGRLVRIDAIFLDQSWSLNESTLLLQADDLFFHAPVGPELREAIGGLETGTRLQLTGVCSILRNERGEPAGLRLFVRSTDDILIDSSPPLNLRRLLPVLLAAAAAVIAALGWVVTLRSRVKQQTNALRDKNTALESEVAERQRAEAELFEAHQKIVEKSRLAGMAEVATGVLHNVGNVLNSVNVSSNVLADRIKKSRLAELRKAVELLSRHQTDLNAFLSEDGKGRKLPIFLAQVTEKLSEEQESQLKELEALQANIAHIKDIVSVQQSYAKRSGLTEKIQLSRVLEDMLCMNQEILLLHNVRVRTEFEEVAEIESEKHKIIQILVNLVRNAARACADSERVERRICLRLAQLPGMVAISVSDNGVGIPPENLTKIFNHGFTTRKDGHGFGLHSSANAAKELGGELRAESAGPGHGATFTLELPSGIARHSNDRTADLTQLVHAGV